MGRERVQMSKDLLIEIGLEEMPARFVTSSIDQLAEKLEKWLEEKKISHGTVSKFSTPRRLGVLVRDVAEDQEDVSEEVKGPAKKIALDAEGNWTKAAIGFTRGQGVTVDDIYFKEMNGVEYVHVNKFIKGQPVKDLLPELKHVISGLSFPKNMRWAHYDLRYVRPIKWMVALFGEEVIPFSITNVQTGNKSYGHRFLGEEITIQSPASYEEQLEKQFVIANAEKRKEQILAQLRNLEEKNGWIIPVDEELLEEVNNLVEYPTALYGGFEEEFLELPERVLITSMKEHQRYFPVKDQNGQLLPFFVTVRNGNDNGLTIVSKGNEKVLRARLADAAFFYKEDQKTTIESSLKKLETIVYHEEIGTLSEKVQRVRALTNRIAEKLNVSDSDKIMADRAAEISKFDLVSHMVYEFPELQGYMGERYALMKGEPKEVAKAINEHYMPRHAEDSVPTGVPGALLSVADKLDTIASCFAIGIIPTGSQDPYALRRQASGIVAILFEKNWGVTIEELIDDSLEFVEAANIGKRDLKETKNDLITFFKARMKHLLTEKGIRYDLIDAVLESKNAYVHHIVERALVLDEKKDSEGFKESMEALSRVMNIAVKMEEKTEVEPALFENEYESVLYRKFKEVKASFEIETNEKARFELLVSLKPEIEQYFEHTMVMADNERLKKNRLSLMHEMSELFLRYAAMNKILTA
jgi:glycyl-tRNA synthetase beta chain